MSIGKNVEFFRKRKGYTQQELGDRLGVTNQAVSKWETETSLPDIMMLPLLADTLGITINDLYAEPSGSVSRAESPVLDEDAVHHFPKDSQGTVLDALCRKTNLLNCGAWDLLKAKQNDSAESHEHLQNNYTACCLSDLSGAVFVSDSLTVIDANVRPAEISSVFEKAEIASGMKKLSDSGVRLVLSHVCSEYFRRSSPFDSADADFFTTEIKPEEISRAVGLPAEEVTEALEKMIALHLVDVQTRDGVRYYLQKVKAIEAAVTLRLMERFLSNEVGFGCGDFIALVRP